MADFVCTTAGQAAVPGEFDVIISTDLLGRGLVMSTGIALVLSIDLLTQKFLSPRPRDR